MAKTTIADLCFFILRQITLNGIGSAGGTENITVEIKNKEKLWQKILCCEVWICALFMTYSLALFIKGIAWKHSLIVPFILSMLYVVSLPLGVKTSEALTSSPFGEHAPTAVMSALSDRGCSLIYAVTGALFVLSFYSYLRFTPVLIFAFCIKSILSSLLNIDSFALSLLFLITALALYISYKKQFYYAENLIIAILFCSSGSMLFLSLSSISTGQPYLFMDGEPKIIDFLLWITLCVAGFILQISIETSFK
ncbi:hypothetical protein PAEPH01_1911 [Pancytospora epiphaga]|nr:hypothetical protein PAEPH01_1911 [Pancytospora epiphaga]